MKKRKKPAKANAQAKKTKSAAPKNIKAKNPRRPIAKKPSIKTLPPKNSSKGIAVSKKTKASKIPVERQTQIVAGSLAFLGTLLGSEVDPNFYFIPGFVGLGLFLAGASGYCLLTKMLSRMPWNS